MILDLQIDHDSEIPVYRQIAEAIRAAATAGRLESGGRLPPTRDLARQLGVNRNTVVAAYDLLASEGRVHSHTGRGTFLAERIEAADRSANDEDDEPWFTGFTPAVDAAALGGLQSIYRLVLSREGISFAGSYPAAEMIPIDAIRGAFDQVLRRIGSPVLGYGPTAGYPSLRETIARRMRDAGSTVDTGDLLVTNGAQQAVELVFRTFLDRGDAAVIEEPTYTGALSVLGSLGARPIAVPMDDDGMRPDLLEIALQRHRPRLIYLQPTFQNPTTRVMSEARRREILRVATRYRCPVVEDDWAGELRFEGPTLPTLHAIDGGRHVIYLSTFSKKLAPGLRVGWVCAPPVVLERLVELKRVEDCGTSLLLQAALDRFVRDGGLDEHLARIRPAYLERRDCMLRALRKYFPQGAEWTLPQGGLFLWLTLPSDVDGDALFDAARQNGVLYSRGDLFHSDGSGTQAMRLAYSAATPDEIESGIKTIGGLIERRGDRTEATGQETIDAMPIL